MTNYKESPDRIRNFEGERDRASNGNCIVVPSIYIVTGKNSMGNARHLVHDFLGVVQDISEERGRVTISGSIPPTKAEAFLKTAKNASYISDGRLQYSTKICRSLKA